MKYDKSKEDYRVARHIRLVDQYGNEIPGLVSYDTDTKIAEVMEYENVTSGPLVKKTKFLPNAIAVVEDQARPDEEHMQKVREKHTGKRQRDVV